MAAMTVEHSITKSEPSIATGRRRPGSVRLAQGHALASQRQDVAVSFQAHGRGQQIDVHALGLGMLHLFHQAGHFLAAAAVEDAHIPRAQPDRRAGAIHGRIAASDHHDIAAQRRRISVGHQFQELDARQRVLLALATQPLRALRADRQEHGVRTPGAIRPA